MKFRSGDSVDITADGRTLAGMVTLASPNGVSLMLEFDGMLDGHLCAMPVQQEPDGRFVSLFTGKVVTLQRTRR